MNNFKSVTNLPFAESAEGLNLIVNDGGAAKQIAASAVGNKTKRELVYEWNFDYDVENHEGVCEIFENVDDNLMWFITKENSVNYEIEVSEYIGFFDNDDPTNYLLGEGSCLLQGSGRNEVIAYYPDEKSLYNWTEVYGNSPFIFPLNLQNKNCNSNTSVGIDFYIYPNFQWDQENETAVKVEQGGSIEMYSYGLGFKSVKIYKVTK